MNYFQSVLFCTLKITYVGFNCSIPSPTLGVVNLWLSHCGLSSISLVSGNGEHLFIRNSPFSCLACGAPSNLLNVFYWLWFFTVFCFSFLSSKSSSGWPGTHPVAVWPWAFPLEPPRCWNFKHVLSQLLKILF